MADSSQSDRSVNLIRNSAGNSIAIVRRAGGAIVDAVTSGGSANVYTEGPRPSELDSPEANIGLSRCPDGVDTDRNNADFSTQHVTPGSPNSCPGFPALPPSPLVPPQPPWPPVAPSPPPSPPIPDPSSEVAFYFFVQQWPGSWKAPLCQDPTYPLLSLESQWTLHGLWPEFADGTYPSSCNPNDPFRLDALDADLLQEMGLVWPSFACLGSTGMSDDEFFWAHEWEKHGTCSGPGGNTQAAYFTTVVRRLRPLVPIYDILAAKKIIPGQSYTVSALTTALVAGLGFAPGSGQVSLNCRKKSAMADVKNGSVRASSASEILEEVWVCVSLDFKIIPCKAGIAKSTCGSGLIEYPHAFDITRSILPSERKSATLRVSQ
eukprot:TRINITY_DN19644_c0_g1_i1.p1 TRINITY_DN19644_c0_g1~~TRINITY_DN19644_c0_g1_i1.p1  ORF type:complete len:436 (-),score=57.94 TRINITY_DN19644_c0_g1_i1:181-1311(-)